MSSNAHHHTPEEERRIREAALDEPSRADALAAAGLDTARREELRIVAQCPFVRKYLQERGKGPV